MVGKSAEVVDVTTQHRATRLGSSHDHRIHGATASRLSSNKGRAPGSALWQLNLDVACLQEVIGSGVGSWVAAQALDEDDAWDHRWPESSLLERRYQRRRPCRTLGQPANTAAVEDEHADRGSASLSRLVLSDPPDDGLGLGKLGGRRLPDLGDEIRQICIGLVRELLAP